MEARIFKGDVMKIIISPAKKMRVDNDTFVPLSKPEFLHKTLQIKGSKRFNGIKYLHLYELYKKES